MEVNYTSKNIDHLGLVSGMIDELNIVSLLDGYLHTDGISASQLVAKRLTAKTMPKKPLTAFKRNANTFIFKT